jgi:hypothetical protein
MQFEKHYKLNNCSLHFVLTGIFAVETNCCRGAFTVSDNYCSQGLGQFFMTKSPCIWLPILYCIFGNGINNDIFKHPTLHFRAENHKICSKKLVHEVKLYYFCCFSEGCADIANENGAYYGIEERCK